MAARLPYKRIRIDGTQVYEHRHVYVMTHGQIPAGYVVHHIDHDHTNNDPANLAAVPRDEHANHHLNEERNHA
jgi:hypothetical protein